MFLVAVLRVLQRFQLATEGHPVFGRAFSPILKPFLLNSWALLSTPYCWRWQLVLVGGLDIAGLPLDDIWVIDTAGLRYGHGINLEKHRIGIRVLPQTE
jgi:hypothetical protein